MSETLENIDLKKREGFLAQYIALRNSYAELLLTSPVTRAETETWLKRTDIEIRGIVQDTVLLGIVILYLDRGGEIAFFAKERNKGIGSQLLHIITQVAHEKRLKSLWAWVLQENIPAQKAFEKNGFIKKETTERDYQGITKQGIEYRLAL